MPFPPVLPRERLSGRVLPGSGEPVRRLRLLLSTGDNRRAVPAGPRQGPGQSPRVRIAGGVVTVRHARYSGPEATGPRPPFKNARMKVAEKSGQTSNTLSRDRGSAFKAAPAEDIAKRLFASEIVAETKGFEPSKRG